MNEIAQEHMDRYYDALSDDDSDIFRGEYAPKHPKCKRCKADNVMWLMHKGNWRLHNNETGELHICPAPSPQSDFAQFKK